MIDNLIWWIGYFTIWALAITVAGGVVFLSYILASMIVETSAKWARATRATKSWLAYYRWHRMYTNRFRKLRKI